MFDGIEFRGFSQEMVEDLAKYSGVPVWNGLTDAWHPTQMLADYMTVKENFGHLDGIKLTYVGDGRNNVANSLLVAGPMLGVDVTICSPKALFPSQDYIDIAERRAKQDGGSITITDNIDEGVKDADVIYTDVWVSMGEESEFESRIKLLKDYQVNRAMFDKTGKDSTIFLHCLPAFHMSESDGNKLSKTSLIGLVIGSMIGGGAFNIISDMGNQAGGLAIIIGWIITAIGMISLAFVFQNLTNERQDLDGGIYSYAQAGFGDFIG